MSVERLDRVLACRECGSRNVGPPRSEVARAAGMVHCKHCGYTAPPSEFDRMDDGDDW